MEVGRPIQEAHVFVQVRGDSGSNQISIGYGYGDLQVDLKYIQEEEPIGFSDWLDVQRKEKMKMNWAHMLCHRH